MIGAHDWRFGAIALGLLATAGGCVPPVDAAATASAPDAVRDAPAHTAPPLPVVPAAPVLHDFALAGSPEQGGVLLGQAPGGTRTLSLDGKPVALAGDGGFLIAFDRDAGPVARLVATLADGRTVARDLIVVPGRWRIEHINAPYRGSASSDAEFARRRPAELEQIAAARATDHASDGWRQRFVWPVSGRRSGFFGAQRVYQGKPGSYHSGADVAVPAGTPFVAPADGVVVLAAAAPFTLEGHLLIVDHGMGLNSAFLHCQRLDVKVGDRVVQGQRLGTVGATGRATGPHMHWGMTWRGARIDPAKVAAPMAG